MKNATKTAVAPKGAILLSQKTNVGFKQTAWTDDNTYVAPFVGEADQNKMFFAIQSKLCGPRTSVRINSIDIVAKTVNFTLSYSIGD